MPGHEDAIGNKAADLLAKRLGTRRHRLIHSSVAFRKQKAREEVLSNWRKELADEPLTGKFNELNVPVITT